MDILRAMWEMGPLEVTWRLGWFTIGILRLVGPSVLLFLAGYGVGRFCLDWFH